MKHVWLFLTPDIRAREMTLTALEREEDILPSLRETYCNIKGVKIEKLDNDVPNRRQYMVTRPGHYHELLTFGLVTVYTSPSHL
jgi:hypothetical protein